MKFPPTFPGLTRGGSLLTEGLIARAGRAPGGVFSPTDVPGLAVWLKSESGLFQDSAGTTPATANDDPVGLWQDQSGAGNHVTQATAGARPLLKTAVQNGRNTVRFDGTNDSLAFSAAGLALCQNQGAFSMWVVCMSSSSATDMRVLGWDSNVAGNIRVALVRNLDAGAAGVLSLAGRRLDADARFAVNGAAASYTDGVFDIEAALYNFAGNSAALRKNGAELATGATGGAGSTSNTASAAAALGAAQTLVFAGDVGEVLVYQAVPSAGNIASIETYLNGRWAVY